MHPQKSSHPPALSLLFVIILMTVAMVTVAGAAASMQRNINKNKDLFLSTQAYYIARATVEMGIADASKNGGIGYEHPGTDADWDLNGDGVSDATGSYEIFARSKPIDWDASAWDFASATPACTGTDLCYIPIPGTGSAGAGMGDGDDECDFENTSQSWWDNEDDPCNWNRIAYGETVTIPFFYEDSTYADGVADPSDTGLSMFTLKVRTPIPDDGSIAGPMLQTSDDGGDPGDVILNWQFVGECDEDGDTDGDGVLEYETSCYLTAETESSGGGFGIPSTAESLIHESDVNNNASVGYVLNQDSDAETYDGLPRTIIGFFDDPDYNPHELYLQLSVISSLTDTTSTQVPYLEYQIVVDQIISDNKIIYAAEAGVQGKLGTYVRNLQASQSIEENSLVNFVIQN